MAITFETEAEYEAARDVVIEKMLARITSEGITVDTLNGTLHDRCFVAASLVFTPMCADQAQWIEGALSLIKG